MLGVLHLEKPKPWVVHKGLPGCMIETNTTDIYHDTVKFLVDASKKRVREGLTSFEVKDSLVMVDYILDANWKDNEGVGQEDNSEEDIRHLYNKTLVGYSLYSVARYIYCFLMRDRHSHALNVRIQSYQPLNPHECFPCQPHDNCDLPWDLFHCSHGVLGVVEHSQRYSGLLEEEVEEVEGK